MRHMMAAMAAALFGFGGGGYVAQAATEAVVYNFQGGADGSGPAGLIADSLGNLYGTTYCGGVGGSAPVCGVGNGNGTVFRLTPPKTATGLWTKTTLYAFKATGDGVEPAGPLLLDASGALYGVTYVGGFGVTATSYGTGTIFKLTPPAAGQTAWTETILYSPPANGVDRNPGGNLVMDSAGALYGTMCGGYGVTTSNPCGKGSVFRLTPPAAGATKWTFTSLWRFKADTDGTNPGGLAMDGAGNLYGATYEGGGTTCFSSLGCGTVYKLSPPAAGATAWAESVLWTFAAYDAAAPSGPPVIGAQGELYGATPYGGGADAANRCNFSGIPLGCGTVFKLTPPTVAGGAWSKTTLHAFAGGTSDGAFPTGIVQGPNSKLYGSTSQGGTGANPTLCGSGCGTVFALTPPAKNGPWTETILASFQSGTKNDVASPNTPPLVTKTTTGATRIYGSASYGPLTVNSSSNNFYGAIYAIAP